MAKLRAINKSDFTEKSWRRSPNYLFTANDAVCPLTVQEMTRAIMGMPIAFLCVDEKYSVVAVLGLEPETNYLVGKDGGWRGKYIPALYRAYPFVLAKNEEEEEQLVLCINEDSGLLNDDDSAEAFFDDEGELSATVKQLMELLSAIRVGLQSAARICKLLNQHKLFKPWELDIELEDGKKRIQGFFRIDEAALNELSDEAFIELRQSGALIVVYCQLLSMQRITDLAQFAQAKSKAESTPPSKELNLDGVNMDGNISFHNL
ncbi:MAG: SapC family protein [Gammaproteobacteria bacterium]|jgi:hypothetical protein|nr:SapC family protein [Gammaproteobacteria bacterium]MBT4891403.1 SapC family protein [Gammaproteobacteria bacterium]